MIPRLARHVLNEFGTMYAQLQAAVDALPMAAVTGPSPTKAKLKKANEGLAAKNTALSADHAALTARYIDLQCSLERKVCTLVRYLYDTVDEFSLDFSGFFLIFFMISSIFVPPPYRSAPRPARERSACPTASGIEGTQRKSQERSSPPSSLTSGLSSRPPDVKFKRCGPPPTA